MYNCEQCGEKAEIQGCQSVDQHDTPYVESWVVCTDCGYRIPKDTADRNDLLEACKRASVLCQGWN